MIVADAGYGDCAEFRQCLDDRDLSYIIGAASTHTACPNPLPVSTAPSWLNVTKHY